MAALVCGLDIGSTNLKVLLAEADGRTLWVKSVPTPRKSDGLGICSDATALVEQLEDLILEGWRAVAKGRALAAICATGVGEDGVAVDAKLRPLGLAIPWFDKRAEMDARALANSDAAAGHRGLRFDFYTTAAKWRWLGRERPQEIAGARAWIALTDYPAAWWARAPFISATLAARTSCYDIATRRWIDALLRESGAPPLPPVQPAGAAVGTMSDGPLCAAGAATAATLLVAGGHDHPIAASAIQRLDNNARIDSLGTANVIYGEAPTLTGNTVSAGLDISMPVRGGAGVALMGVTEFAAPLVEGFDAADLRTRLAAEEIAGAPEATPPASLHPLPAEPATRLRQILDYNGWKAEHFFATMRAAGVPEVPIYAIGGWSRSTALMQLRASLFGSAITVIDEPELTALGAALLAAEASGHMPVLGARRHVIEPRPDWTEIYRGWR